MSSSSGSELEDTAAMMMDIARERKPKRKGKSKKHSSNSSRREKKTQSWARHVVSVLAYILAFIFKHFFRWWTIVIFFIYLGIYFSTFTIQQHDPKTFWFIDLGNGILTNMSHRFVCPWYPLQIPGYRICPRSQQLKQAIEDDWAGSKENVVVNIENVFPRHSPSHEACPESTTAEGPPSNVLRHIGFQEQIDWWTAQVPLYAALDKDIRLHLYRRDLDRLNFTCRSRNGQDHPTLAQIQSHIHILRDIISEFTAELRTVQEGTMRFESIFVASVEGFVHQPQPNSSSPYREPWWWEFGQKREERALRKAYIESVNAAARILDELFLLANSTAGLSRDIHAEKIGLFSLSIREFEKQVEKEEKCIERQQQNQQNEATLFRRIWSHVTGLWTSTSMAYAEDELTEEQIIRERRELLDRGKVLAGNSFREGLFIWELLLSRQADIKELSKFAEKRELVRVMDGVARVRDQAYALCLLAEWQCKVEVSRIKRKKEEAVKASISVEF